MLSHTTDNTAATNPAANPLLYKSNPPWNVKVSGLMHICIKPANIPHTTPYFPASGAKQLAKKNATIILISRLISIAIDPPNTFFSSIASAQPIHTGYTFLICNPYEVVPIVANIVPKIIPLIGILNINNKDKQTNPNKPKFNNTLKLVF